MLKRLSWFIFFTLIFAGCEDRDVRTPAVAVVVHGDINYWKFADSWAYLTDDNGTVFDAQPLSNNTTTQLVAVANAAKLNLTIFTVFKDALNDYYFNTYTDLTRGQEFHLHRFPAPAERQPSGTVKLSINNYSESTIEYGAIAISALDGINSFNNIKNTNNTYSADVSLYSFPQDIFLSAYRNGMPVYKLLKDVGVNSIVVLDFNEFTPAESILKPVGTDVTVIGFPDDAQQSGYPIASSLEYSLTSADPNLFTIGYPALFKNYFTRIRKLEDGALMQLEKRGDPVMSLNFPEFSYAINNPSIENFEVDVSANVTYKAGRWTNAKNTNWLVYSAPGKRSVVRSIPTALSDKYNDIGKINTFKLFELNLFRHSAGDYHGWLNSEFGEQSQKNFERFTEEVQQD